MDKLVSLPLEEIMGESFGRYSKYIIQERAIPDARDGLKPGQRRIIFAMFKDLNIYSKPYRKSAKTVGNVIGNYHPHGDSSIYETMVRMSQPWKLRYPLIDMHGNNGSIDDDPAAAMRYTEARMSEIAQLLVENINDETVKWTLNFDDTEYEPTVLPSKIPNLLINGSSGIASGYATEIPPHNLVEVIKAIIYRINNPNCLVKDVMKIIKGPDFPTGGIISNVSGILQAFEKGKGKVLIRAKTKIIKNQILISEIPFGVYKAQLIKEMDLALSANKVSGVEYIRDESDRKGLCIAIGLKPKVNGQTILNFLFQKTRLQTWFNYNMISIVEKKPVLCSINDLLDTYIKHQFSVLKNRLVFRKNKLEKKDHILTGLIIAIENIDKIIQLIRASKSKQESKQAIIDAFGFSQDQAEAIVNLRLYRLSSTDIKDVQDQKKEVENELNKINTLLSSDENIYKKLSSELEKISEKFGDKRRSKIQKTLEKIQLSQRDLIASEIAWISVSRKGYIKRCSVKSYKASQNLQVDLVAHDVLVYSAKVNTFKHITLLFKSGNFTTIPIYKLVEKRWKDKGQHLSSLITLPDSDQVVASYILDDVDGFIVQGTAKGMVKKTPTKDFALVRWSRPSKCINLKENDFLISAKLVKDKAHISFVSSSGFANKYDFNDIPTSGLKSQGVKGINLVGEKAVGMAQISSNSQLAFVTTKGYAKRFKVDLLPISSRTNKGLRINKLISSNPQLILWYDSVSANSKITIAFENHNLLENATKIPLFDLASGNNKFIKGKELIYDVVKSKAFDNTTKNLKSVDNFNLKNKVSNDINLIDILEEI